jgi:hypothetical protein
VLKYGFSDDEMMKFLLTVLLVRIGGSSHVQLFMFGVPSFPGSTPEES